MIIRGWHVYFEGVLGHLYTKKQTLRDRHGHARSCHTHDLMVGDGEQDGHPPRTWG